MSTETTVCLRFKCPLFLSYFIKKWALLFTNIKSPNIIFLGRDSPQWTRASTFTRFLDHTQRRTTVGRTPLDEWSARRKDLYLTTHNTHFTDIHAPGGIRTHDPSRRAAADLRLRPRGHWDRPPNITFCRNLFINSHITWENRDGHKEMKVERRICAVF